MTTPRSGAPVSVLLVEDNASDVRLVIEDLRSADPGGFVVHSVSTLAEALGTLGVLRPEVVLLDLSLPDSHGLNTFTALADGAPGIPVVILSGHDDAEGALGAVRAGAQDYIVKGTAGSALLAKSLRYAIERQRLMDEREEARKTARDLSELIPICASCKQIRDDQGLWNQLEQFMEAHSGLAFSHGICPACASRLYGEDAGGGSG